MDGGLPMLNCLLQHTLRSLCTRSDSSNSSRWDYGGGALDRVKGNKRNWILVWEDGFCDFYQCEQAGSGYIKGRFGADVFFKMSHEVYNYGEGLIGKVAADNSHKWVFRDSPNEKDSSFISWNVSIDPQPKTWEFQFNSGIQTIAIISVREGIVQLGSFDKIGEDLNLVISIQRKFSYLQSIPGIYAIQRPYLPIQHPYTFKPNNPHMMIETNIETSLQINDKRQLTGTKRLYGEESAQTTSPIKAINLGYSSSPQNGVTGPPPVWSIPPLLPPMSCSFGALLSKLPSVVPSYNAIEALDHTPVLISNINDTNNTTTNTREGGVKVVVDNCGVLSHESQSGDVKVESSNQEEKPSCLNPNLGLEDGVVVGLGFGPMREGGASGGVNPID
ncbi:uncharacterized protein LOC132278850 isoform X2 [Cornus florida]|uniref:uncharacterized protein LOC132278850 isoform X2 n=1 Tax=Cornus florida TaxID=4283 RepID=UPI00289B5170|nr:uncharacterized protein LOC132278850 isoform X2 [Cornus florida]